MSSPVLSVVAEASTWSPINLQEAVSGDYTGPQPALLRRSDGKCLTYPGKLHSIAGEPGGGKSWIAQVLCAQILTAGSNVLYVDFEDFPESVVSRLKILGVPDQTILERFGYVSPSERVPPHGDAALDAWIAVVDLVVLDGVTDAMTLHGWNPLDNKDAAEFMQTLVGPFASGVRRPAVLMVDHVTKSSDQRGGYAIGAQHKRAAVQVQFTVKTTRPFDQDHDGTITMSVTKDRYGQVQRLTSMGGSKEVARFHFKHLVPGNEAMTVYIDPPAGSRTSGESSFDPTMLREILEAIDSSADGLNKTQIKDLVTGRGATLIKGLHYLRDSGLVEGAKSGNSVKWTLARPLEGISPATEGVGAVASESDWVSAVDIGRVLGPSSFLPHQISGPEAG